MMERVKKHGNDFQKLLESAWGSTGRTMKPASSWRVRRSEKCQINIQCRTSESDELETVDYPPLACCFKLCNLWLWSTTVESVMG